MKKIMKNVVNNISNYPDEKVAKKVDAFPEIQVEEVK